jgi:hypothetical protein
LADAGFANVGPASPVAGFSKRRRTFLLLLGEKAGMREDVKHYFSGVFGATPKTATGTVAFPSKDPMGGHAPAQAKGSLGWTNGAIGVECDGMTSLFSPDAISTKQPQSLS